MRHPVELLVALSSFLLACFVPVCCVCAFALDPSLDISQYAHTAWKVREGFGKGSITSIAQTSDGYLWLGTHFGLLRFDGVRNVAWQPPTGQRLPSFIYSLLAARDGTLWIGTQKGLVSWDGSRLTQYPALASQVIVALLEDSEGMIWAGGQVLPKGARLCAIHGSKVHCDGEDGSLGDWVSGLYQDTKGTLWVRTRTGLWRWKPGAAQFYQQPGEPSGFGAPVEDSTGTILFPTGDGIGQLVNGKIETYKLPGDVKNLQTVGLLRDRNGGFWIGTLGRGLLHSHDGRVDVYESSDGLSADRVTEIVEDREGNVWVATEGGLDRFREFAATTFTKKQGLSDALVASVLANGEGDIWLSTLGGLDRLHNGEIGSYEKPSGKLNQLGGGTLFQDRGGRVWLFGFRGSGCLQNDHFVPVSAVPKGVAHSVAEDANGDLWIAHQDAGLVGLRDGKAVQQIPWAGLGYKDHAMTVTADPRGGVWLGFFSGGVEYLAEGAVPKSHTTANGLGDGTVNSLRFDGKGVLWAATEGGLSRLKDGHFATLSGKNGLPCDPVHWMIEDDDHALWLYMPCGLVRIAQGEMDAWKGAADKNQDSKQNIKFTLFDSSDGVRTTPVIGIDAQVAKSHDGKLWFSPWDGVSVIDPHHLPVNKIPPPVHVEQITADGKTYDPANGLQLPPHVRDLTIDYTALSLVAPEKIHFRYKLEGQDPEWREVVNDRQVQYSNLAPRHYRFRVMACNNSGVWNEAGAALDFVIPPAWYQTNWFRAACALAFLTMLWAMYELRVRQLAAQFNMRLDERVNERTRIARELHDTLLQNFQGLLPRLQAAIYMLPERGTEARKTLESAVDKASEAITEGRDAIKAMRLSTVEKNDLAVAVRTLGEELAVAEVNQSSPTFEVAVQGTPRSLHPILRDEVYRLAAEAMRNAFCHAQARKIEVEIRYGEREFRLQVRDNGRGIDPSVLSGDGREGHYGLHGMHERAKIAGGKLKVWSELDSGTEVELSIPAMRAYTQPPRRLRLLQKLSRKDKDRQEKV